MCKDRRRHGAGHNCRTWWLFSRFALKLLCHKPAPIQLSYLGYPGPTYLKCIDGWIGDKVLFEQLNPIDRSSHPLIEISGGYMVFDTGGELPIPKRTARQTIFVW